MSKKNEGIKNDIFSISVGIPAYNEGENIGFLLDSVCHQMCKGFNMVEIVVISDGSTDETDKIVSNSALVDSRVMLISDGERRGKSVRMNMLMERTKSDILVILDADIVLKNNKVLSDLVEPMVRDEAVMHTSGYSLPVAPRTAIEKIAYAGVMIWEHTRNRAGVASQLYFSEGRIRAFRRDMYSVLRFPDASADEAYSFLYGEKKKFPFAVSRNALVRYALPSTLRDYMLQMNRFLKSQDVQSLNFGTSFVRRYYSIGNFDKLKSLVYLFWKNPLWTFLYTCLVPISRFIQSFERGSDSGIWPQIRSTKRCVKTHHRKRVVFSNYDDNQNPWYGGGGAYAVHEVARRMVSKKRLDVTVLTGSYPNCHRNELVDGVQYERVGFSIFGPQMGQLYFAFTLPFRALFRSFDVWVESFTPPFSISFLPFVTSKPVIGLAHMLSGEDMKRKYGIPFDWVEFIGLKAYKSCIATSEIFRKKISISNSKTKIAVIPNGTDLDSYLDAIRIPEHFLFLGRIEVDQKGIDILLGAYADITMKTNIPLVIAGGGTKSEIQKMKQLIEKYQLEDRVKIIGRIDGCVAKRDLFEHSYAVIIPSRFETFSLVALEALASGVPLVTFDIMGLNWISDDVAWKVKAYDQKNLSLKMLEIIQRKGDIESKTERGREFSKNFDWDRKVDQYHEFIIESTKR